MNALIFIRYIIKEYPRLLIFSTVILIVTGLIETVTLLFIAPIVDILISSDLKSTSPISNKMMEFIASIGFPVTIVVLFTFYILLNVIKSGFQTCSTYLIAKIEYTLGRDLLMGSFNDFFRAGWSFFRTSQQGKLINTFTREIKIVGNAFAGVGIFITSIFQLSILVLVPFLISWQVMTISMCVALLLAAPLMFIGKISHRLGAQTTSTANDISISIQESLSSAKVILGFANQGKISEILKHNYNRHVLAALKKRTFSAAVENSYTALGLIAILTTLYAAHWFDVPLSETSILVVSLIKAIPIIGKLPSQKNLIDTSFPSYEQIMNLRDRAKELKQRTGSRTFTGFDDTIMIEDVSFSYDVSKTILDNVNVTIPKGKMIAFVGESGAGKTTLIDAIIGFNEPISGQIKIDGIPLQDFDKDSYRKTIGYVPQENILFNMSIMDNLLWANEDSTNEDIKKVCKLANADEFIEKFPEGYHTVVGDRGVRLSGGQMQRIALARAMIRRPDLLILDEATSALDTKSERIIQKAIEKIASETTLVVIAHRLSTIVNADYVYVMDNGCIEEKGSYDDLIMQRGLFYNMVESQKFSNV